MIFLKKNILNTWNGNILPPTNKDPWKNMFASLFDGCMTLCNKDSVWPFICVVLCCVLHGEEMWKSKYR